MPVTARLSQAFYAKLGDDIANELVNWFNAVDATYRADLRELNELNFARFDAKLEQRVVQLEARLDTRFTQEIARLEAKFDTKIDGGLAGLRAELIKWMFAFWVGNLAVLLAVTRL